MTKEQFKEFVKTTIHSHETITAAGVEKVADMIIAQWESDVNDARIAGQNEADDVPQPDGSEHCMGPCCGGSI